MVRKRKKKPEGEEFIFVLWFQRSRVHMVENVLPHQLPREAGNCLATFHLHIGSNREKMGSKERYKPLKPSTSNVLNT